MADYIVVSAKTDTELPAHKGISMFMVDKDTPGLSIGKHEEKMGIRGSSTVEVIFKDMCVSAKNRIGNEDEGFAIAMKTFDSPVYPWLLGP